MTKLTVNNKLNEINCLGLKCPLPVMRLEKAAASGAKEIKLISNDPISVIDIPLAVQKLGGTYRKEEAKENVYHFYISL